MSNREVTVRITAKDNFTATTNKYKTAMTNAGNATRDVNTKSSNLQRGLQGVSTAMNVAVGAFAAFQGLGIIKDMADLGTKVQNAETVFNQLSGGTEDARTKLDTLRTTTMGVVDDFTLMQSASKLMLSGLAENDTELNNITNLAVKLGAAFGKDAASALDEFNLMLLNQSIPRLDTFGISAATVRNRINELIDSGQAASREEAFKMAVFEEGAIALERLGDAANVAESNTAQTQHPPDQPQKQSGRCCR